jgi:hypothetical protein
MPKVNLLLSWYLTTVTTLVFCLLFLVQLSFDQRIDGLTTAHYQQFKALPASASTLTHQDVAINKTDARPALLADFFKSYRSPLVEASQSFVEIADKYGLDYRLMPAISMQESNGGRIMPVDSYNPFGYGIYGGKVMRFENFEAAIDRVARGLKKDYMDLGLTTPDLMMPKYTPPSLAKGGAWAKGVNTFMSEIQ